MISYWTCTCKFKIDKVTCSKSRTTYKVGNTSLYCVLKSQYQSRSIKYEKVLVNIGKDCLILVKILD